MDSLQQTILAAALPHIAFDGWTMASLERGARDAGLAAAEAQRAFPCGAIEAIEAHSRATDEAMLAKLRSDYTLSTMKVRDRIRTCVMVRLRLAMAEREAVRRALAHLMLPWNAARGLELLHRTVDSIWREAGDTATDWNYYSKRILLGKIYLATLYVWLDDKTSTLEETEAFLSRRIEDVMKIEKVKARAKEFCGRTESAFTRYRPRY
jgi:ubiquinone biosynthesis protein COQ9